MPTTTYNKTQSEMIADLDNEISRVKSFLNDNGYHMGTSIFNIVHRYRAELKELRTLLKNEELSGTDVQIISIVRWEENK